jgi:RHS repeat-associated protein
MLVDYSYSGANVTTKALGNGIAGSYAYTPSGRISDLTYSGSTDPLPSYAFGYAVTGNLSTLTANHMPQASETYGYDAGYQLNEWRRGELVDGTIPSPLERQSWVFDSRGNWEQWTKDGAVEARTHNGVNELLTRDGTTLTYDHNGNMTSHGSKAYVWDEENRLSSVNGAYYQYDAEGRRISKTVAGVTTQYIYDGWQVVQERRNDGVTKFFTYGNYIDEPVCMITATGTSSDTVYYLQGNNYNIAALTDETGQVVEHYGIEPYGTFAVFMAKGADGVWFTSDDESGAASAVGNQVVLQGTTVDGETGDYYFRNRQYGPVVGRFLGRDPAWFRRAHGDLYRFLQNSPLRHVDPLGLDAFDPDRTEVDICQLIRTQNESRIYDQYERLIPTLGHAILPSPHFGSMRFQHCVWNCRMTRDKGEAWAKRMSEEKEKLDHMYADFREILMDTNCWYTLSALTQWWIEEHTKSAGQECDDWDNASGRECGKKLCDDKDYLDDLKCERCCEKDHYLDPSTPDGPPGPRWP